MFLKSIEVRGFKSFADKTELHFKKGITSVVGPNGSGKSNISDAVRWVLGEQSIKNLRGAKMEDVIFIGTEFRKPVGLAQVSLTLNNEDEELKINYSEVKVTRRLYRSGESEYLINNTKCRLKDIQELFMDTGIGKEGYSIIGQGKIDAILSGKPEERRTLLEEAAGIVKFKNRKEEAEKKLESTNSNLVRIKDILNTYEERLEPLKIEMEKAKQFLNLSQELKEKDLALIIHTIEGIEVKINNFKDENKQRENEMGKLLDKKNILKIELEKQNFLLEEQEEKNKANREEYYECKASISEFETKIKVIEEKIKNSDFVISKYYEDIKKLEEELKDILDKKLDLEIEIKDFKLKKEIIEEELSHYEQELSKIEGSLKENNNNIFSFKEQLNSIIEKDAKEERDKDNLDREVKLLLDKINEIKESIENTANLIKINNNTRIRLEEEYNKVNDKIILCEENIKQSTKEISVFRNKLTHEENKYKSKSNDLNKLDANFNILSNLEKQYEGYNKAVRNLMDHVDKNYIKDVKKAYVLGEILKVPKEYESAIEVALGAAISNIITETEYDAKLLINYLKDKKLGRATFLPLNIVKSKNISSKIEHLYLKGYVGRASNLISYNIKFKNAIEFVLGNIIIAENMDCALAIAKEISYSNRIVTLSGEVINVGGSLTGGSIYNKGTNVISRKREIEELENKIQNIYIELKDINLNIEEYNKRIYELDEHNLNLRDALHGENIELIKLKERINSLKEDERRCKNSLLQLESDIQVYTSKINVYKNNLHFLEVSLKDSKLEKEKIIGCIKLLEDGLLNYNGDIESIKEEVVQRRIDLATLKENLINKENKFKELDESIKFKHRDLEEVSLNVRDSSNNLIKYKDEININKEAIRNLEKSIEKYEESSKEEEVFRIKLKNNIKETTSNLENLSLEEEKINRDLNKILMNLTRFETEYETMLQKLNEEYDLTYAQAIDYKIEDIDVNSTKNNIDKLKNNINKLGIVNVGSIEEYREVKEKYSFMNEQKEDMEASKEKIISVIEEMTLRMREIFKENFEKLNQTFHETFRVLFKGGSASLILSDGDELNGKIDINVQPPGKKLQNINLMSGGEKVLSAIALLFSILKMKPTPFCILDEIEAALDDANVSRYAEFLKRFSDRIQFIVITHRKGTMEVSDALYGITMEEKGVSKIVSVDLNKNKKA
ncbi:chromosome segregation protein SMC [Hathewaya histolytica]|uniref:chromosome segregation protein SMC n=1 Tax=Hathewaya histolytica TaxID=1498 RepID=UPI003B67AD15